MEKIKHYWNNYPLQTILTVGIFFRLISVIFSKGFGMFDDHFLVIEASQSWVDHYDYNRWLPWNQTDPHPEGHSFFYVGIHYIMLWFFQNILGIFDPQVKMYIIRFFHAVYSLLIISLGYKITERLSNQKMAKTVGLILAVLWLMPILSVRNLVEVVCIPPLLAVAWNFIKYEEKNLNKYLLMAGMMIGIAMGIRYQTGAFAIGFGLYLILQQRFKAAVIFGVSGIVFFSLTQAADIFIWEQPFAEFQEYVRYNIEHKETYFDRPWYMYLGTIAGLLVPPVSLFMMWGFGYRWKKYLILVLPSFLFFALHSYFPNKQERFILPFVPFLIIAGLMGWEAFKNNSTFWSSREKLYKGLWTFFWVLNTILLFFVTPAYTKKSQVEAMYWLRNQDDYVNMVVEASHLDEARNPPKFYLGHWKSFYYTTKKNGGDWLKNQQTIYREDHYPNYLVMLEEEFVDERKARFENGFECELELVQVIEPSHIDALLHWLNPNNKNFTVRIFKIHDHKDIKLAPADGAFS